MAYAPAGIERAAVEAQLAAITRNVRLAAPAATVEMSRVFAAPDAAPAG